MRREQPLYVGQIVHILRLRPVQKDEVERLPQRGQHVCRVREDGPHPPADAEILKVAHRAGMAFFVAFDRHALRLRERQQQRRRGQPLRRSDLEESPHAAQPREREEQAERRIVRRGIPAVFCPGAQREEPPFRIHQMRTMFVMMTGFCFVFL